MRRRRVLALGTAAIGLAGYQRYVGNIEDDVEDAASPTGSVGGFPGGATDGSSSDGSQQGPVAEPPRIGGTLNGRPRRLRDDLSLIDKSNTTWLHSFLDVRNKLDEDVPPREDPDVAALRQATAETDVKLLVSLRWDFRGIWGDKEPTRVPEAGSDREAALLEYATKLLRAIDHQVEIVALGNEPIWETLDEDLEGKDSPMVTFTRRLRDHLVEHYAGEDTYLLLGAINRLYDPDVMKDYNVFYKQLFEMARSDDSIDGIDVHVHFSDIDEADRMLSIARQVVPDGIITVTEFSPMWRYVERTGERIDSFDGGGGFLDRHGLPADMTVLEFFRGAKRNPVPHDRMADFMKTMSWYNENLVNDMYDVLSKYGADLGTLGFLLDEGVRNTEWDENWRPFQISYLFQRPLIATEDGAHPHYLDDYRNRA